MSGHRLRDERANLGFRRGVQRGEGPRDRVHVGALLTSGVHAFAEAECDEVLIRFDVAYVLAVLHVERESPAYDRFERRRALPDDVVQAFPMSRYSAGASPSLARTAASPFFVNMVQTSFIPALGRRRAPVA